MGRAAATALLVAGALGLAPDAGAEDGGAAAEGRTPVAEIEGHTWRVDDVRGAAAFRIYQLQLDIHSLLRGETEERVDAFLLEREAARRGTSVDAMLEAVQSEAAPVADEEIEAYLAEHPAETGAASDEVRARVRHYLSETRRLERRIAFEEGLREAAGYRFLLPAPVPPRTEVDVAGAPARGPAEASIEIVHFASFSSRNSARSAAKIARLVGEFPGRIRHVHRNLFRERDERALRAARLGYAAAGDGGFWALHDAWFARGGKLDAAAIDAIALENGVMPEDLAAAATADDLLRRVKADLDAARAAGAPREPSLFVNGRYVSGIAPYEEIRGVVVGELGGR